jgi:predicted DNA-binding transcriptional regulator AlpA
VKLDLIGLALLKLLNEKQVAEITGLSTKTLQRWRLFGEGPEWRKLGGAVRYPAEGLAAWIDGSPRGGAGGQGT